MYECVFMNLIHAMHPSINLCIPCSVVKHPSKVTSKVVEGCGVERDGGKVSVEGREVRALCRCVAYEFGIFTLLLIYSTRLLK